MFQSNLEALREKVLEATECRREARKLSNPGRFWRVWQEVIVVDSESNRRASDDQAEIDARREELEARERELMESAAAEFREIGEWLEERGVDMSRVVNRMNSITGHLPGPREVDQVVRELSDLVSLTILAERAEAAAQAAEEELLERAHRAAEENGCEIEIQIFQS